MGRRTAIWVLATAVVAGAWAGHDLYGGAAAGGGGAGRAAAVATGLATVDGSYRFLSVHDGRPATWACDQPIEVAVRRGGVGDDVIADLLASLETVSAASGFSLRYVGETEVVPDSSFDDWRTDAVEADVVVAFVQRGESDLLGDHAAANGGGDWRAGDGDVRYTSGSVVVAVEDLAAFLPGAGHLSRQALFTHELLHVMNLAHVEDAGSIMTGDLRDSYGHIGAGDLAGLAHLLAVSCGG